MQLTGSSTAKYTKNTQLNSKKTATQPINRQETYIDVSPRSHTDAQQAHEYMLTITNYWRTANQNYSEVPPHTSQTYIIYKSTNHKCWRGSEERMLLHSYWECKLAQPPWKMVWRYLRKLNIELPYNPAIPLLGKYPDKTC